MHLPSTVDWCEINYNKSEYIAEFWNTISGLFLVASGALYYKNNVDWMQNNIRFYIHFARIASLLVFVGFGTMLFHGTLYYPFQLLDELPMILLANEYLVLLMSLETTKSTICANTFTKLNTVLLFTYKMLPIIVISYFVNPTLQVLSFHITLKFSELSVLFVLYRLSKSLNQVVYSKIYVTQDYLKTQLKQKTMVSSSMAFGMYNSFNRSKQNDKNLFKESTLLRIVQNRIKKYLVMRNELKTVTRIGIYVYSTSIGIWCLEHMFCKYVEPLQFHAIWHIMSSVGVYHLNLIMQLHVSIDYIAFKEE